MNEIEKIIHRAEAGHMYPQDQLVIWAAFKSLINKVSIDKLRSTIDIMSQYIANGLNHVRQMKANAHDD